MARLVELSDRCVDLDTGRVTGHPDLRAMELEVLRDADGGFAFYFDDGDLFDGHVVVVRGDVAHGPSHAKMEG